MREFGLLFTLDDLDLGKTSIVKHNIKVMDMVPFKERYRHIPQHQFEEVKKHLQERLAIRAIHKLCSPWASTVVLVQKKDVGLCFCIDLHKLNMRIVNDAYDLPHIDETLNCLNGAKIFTSLELKLGYLQVKLNEESKKLTSFMVCPLGFYKFEQMPFGLINVLATF